MRFLVDECAGLALARWLKDQGHDVIAVCEAFPGKPDEEVLTAALADGRILITADKGFGAQVHRDGRIHHGVVLLRLQNDRAPSRIDAMTRLLRSPTKDIPGRFIVITEHAIRVRRCD